MKLLITLDFPPETGGIQQYLFNIVRFRYVKGDAVLVGCRPSDRKHSDTCMVPVTRVSSPLSRLNKKFSLLSLIPVFFYLIARAPAGVTIECGNLYAAVVPWLFHLLGGRSYRVYTYGTELLPLYRRESLKARVLRSIVTRAELIYALGTYTVKILNRCGRHQNIEIVPPKIYLPPQEMRTRTAAGGRFRILSVGRLVEHKGHHVLIDAAGRLPEDCPWELVIVGDGPRRDALRAACSPAVLRDRVLLKAGLTEEEVREEYRKARTFVLPSLEGPSGTEGFGIVLLEAMSYAVPIVASATGGIVEVLDNGSCGLLVEPGNPDALARALLSLWNNTSLGDQLSSKAFHRLIKYYVWNT